jgi:hypothetical protein
MNNHLRIAICILFFASVLLAQRNTRKTLVVNDSSSPNAVIQINGKSYADVQSLARMLNGSLSFQSDRVILRVPDSNSSSAPVTPTNHLSPEFQRAAINALSQAREYKGVVVGVLQAGAPITGTWLQNDEGQAVAAVSQAQIAASTDGDRNAFALFQNGFSQLQTWANAAIADRKAMNATRSLSENALQNDPTLAKLALCGKSFAKMIASGTFADEESCH